MKKVFVVLFGLFLILNAEGSMVSFYLIETGLSENVSDNNYAVQWENAFMDVFFDGGLIVSNAPILRLLNKPSGDILRHVNMNEAKNAGIDFVVIGQLDFAFNGAPSDITFFIYQVTPREKILERQFQGRTSRPAREEFEYMKSIARGLITYIQ